VKINAASAAFNSVGPSHPKANDLGIVGSVGLPPMSVQGSA